MEKEYITKNREAYNIFAKQHNDRLNVNAKEELDDNYWINLIKKELLVKDNYKVLEIGPGSGRILRILEELKCRTTAVELSSEMIKYAKIQSPNTIFIEDDILNVNFYHETFDAIFMGALIHNFPTEDVKKLLKLVKNWITKDGRILIYTTIHEKSEEGYFTKEDYKGNIVRFRKKFKEDELTELINEIDFKIHNIIHTEEPNRNKKWILYILGTK